MIVIDIIFNIYSYIIFLPFLSYLLKSKRKITYYILYGLLLDLMFLNYYLLNTLILIFSYKFFPKKRKYYFRYYFSLYNLLLSSNLLVHNNLTYILSPFYITSLILNLIFYIYCDKKYFI